MTGYNLELRDDAEKQRRLRDLWGDPSRGIPGGACVTAGVEMAVEPWDEEGVAAAKKVCAACAKRVECLDFALTYREVGAVWGGMDDRERDEHRAELARRRQALRAV